MMEQTPVHEVHNSALLNLMPKDASFIVEVGCSSGALAREFKKLATNNNRYVGIEIDCEYGDLAKRYCDHVIVGNIENFEDSEWLDLRSADCWVFGDTLEHLQDPWRVLSKIRSLIPSNGVIVCCIPNAQHWSLQVKLNLGEFRYEKSGLLDKTHLRWFTRQTIFELFKDTGFIVAAIDPLIFDEPLRDQFISLLKRISQRAGRDPEITSRDALPMQYVLIATPDNLRV